MPRIQKTQERWFEVPNDPDKGRVKIKHLSPGELAEINDSSFKKEMNYSSGKGKKDEHGKKMAPDVNVDIKEDPVCFREMPVKKAVVAWENHFDSNGKKMKCTPENIEEFIRNDDSFLPFINECRERLATDVAAEKEERRKGRAKKKLEGFCIRTGEVDCVGCRATYAFLKDTPPCWKCLPELQEENGPVYEVYCRVFNITEPDPFQIMDMIGIDEKDKLMCLDLIHGARNEVMRTKDAKGK